MEALGEAVPGGGTADRTGGSGDLSAGEDARGWERRAAVATAICGHAHMEEGGFPVSPGENGGAWGEGTRSVCLGSMGIPRAGKKAEGWFFSTAITRRLAFLLDLFTQTSCRSSR